MTGISRLRAWLSAKVRAGMGILVRQDNICMAMAERSENGGAELVWQEEYVRGNDEGVEDFWARAALGGLRSCPEEGECYLVLEGQEVFFYEKQFPDMADRELQQSLRLDFAAASGWHRSFAFGYERLADGRFRLGGILRERMAERLSFWQQYFSMAGCVLFVGAAGAEGAARGAMAALGGEGIRFDCVHPVWRRWDWLRCGGILWGASLSIFLLAGGWLGYMGYETGQELRAQRERLALLSDIGERRQAIEENKQVAERKNKAMGRIRENGLRCQGLLVTVGNAMPEGSWLTGMSAEAGHRLVLSGKAAGYRQVSELMERLQADEEFFQGKIYLASADVGKDGMISFQLKGSQ